MIADRSWFRKAPAA